MMAWPKERQRVLLSIRDTQSSLRSRGTSLTVVKCAAIPQNSKVEQTAKKKRTCLTRAGTQTYRCFEMHDLITRESKVQVVTTIVS